MGHLGEIRVGSSPEVEEAMIASAGAAWHACASRSSLSGSRSGADSCTSSAPATASATVAASVSFPGVGGGTSVSRDHARRARSSAACAVSAASGAGS